MWMLIPVERNCTACLVKFNLIQWCFYKKNFLKYWLMRSSPRSSTPHQHNTLIMNLQEVLSTIKKFVSCVCFVLVHRACPHPSAGDDQAGGMWRWSLHGFEHDG